MKLCPVQELCRHFSNGTKRRVHHIRITEPCKLWLAMDCSIMGQLAQIQEYCTGEPMACNLDKIREIKKQIKDG